MKSLVLLLSLTMTWANPLALEDFATGSTKFAASVYKELSAKPGDFLVSPLSAQLILALSERGAKNETSEEIRSALKLPHCKEIVDETIKSLMENLGRDPEYVLHTANKIYIKENCPLREQFLALAQNFYKARTENIDFSAKEAAAEKMNRWVEEETDHKIRDLIDPGILSNETRAVLINALLFKGNWTVPFQVFSTANEDFHTFGGTVRVETMHLYEESLRFYEKPNLNATFLELPFRGENVSMVVVLPDHQDGLGRLEEHIDEVLEAPETTRQEVFNVALPKFRIESRTDFKSILQNLGVKKAFEDGKADFSGIAGEKGEMFIDDVVQKSFVDVDEFGSEAGSATFVVKIVNRNGETPREFQANHPFIFFIKINNIVILLGRVVQPNY